MAKEKSITREVIAEAVSYNPETGKFTRVKAVPGHNAGAEAGTIKHQGYRVVGVGGQKIAAHRLAWFIACGSWPDGDIDHINGDRSDNRITNLRCVTRGVNLQNTRKAHSDSASGVLGVTARGNKWRATIFADGRCRHLGLFDSIHDAHAAYLEAKRRLHPGCTV
jgi:hypothetical protein